MPMSIKNAETERLAQELAALTGETLTGAITGALRERLDKVRKARNRPLAQRLIDIGEQCAARIKEPYRSADPGDLLYDERGLPR